jgi:uncharacterized phosphosugar-binding protein
MSVASEYLAKCEAIVKTVKEQEAAILQAAEWFATSIARGGLVHCFGSGHSRIMVEEMWPRYGSFSGFNPIVELSLTNHHAVVGANGQRQAMFLENVSGLAERILRNFGIQPFDSALVVSSSGCNIVPIEMAEQFRKRNIKTVAIVTRQHLEASPSKRADGKKLSDFADLVLDTGAPAGDSMQYIEGLATPVSPGSTLGGVMLVNAVKAEVANLLTRAGQPPKVLTASCLVGHLESARLFEAAYDEHGRRMANALKNAGNL